MDRETAMAIVSRCSTTPFLVKLWKMLDDPDNAHAMEWSASGESFEVKSAQLMSRDVLPKHFRHNNFSSFQRQLNYFGFRKTGKGSSGCLYSHDDFCLHRPQDVPRIRRKTNRGGAKGHHTNKVAALTSIDISPLNAPSAAGSAINGRAPVVRPGMPQLQVAVPARHSHGTRRAVRINKRAADSPREDYSRALKRQRADETAQSADASSPCAAAAARSSGATSDAGGPKRPRLGALAPASAASSMEPFSASSCGDLGLFDMDPCLSPLSPLTLGAVARSPRVPWQHAGAGPFPGLEPYSAEPFSPLLTPRGSFGLSVFGLESRTPREHLPPSPGGASCAAVLLKPDAPLSPRRRAAHNLLAHAAAESERQAAVTPNGATLSALSA